jgi:hypothetical protein
MLEDQQSYKKEFDAISKIKFHCDKITEAFYSGTPYTFEKEKMLLLKSVKLYLKDLEDSFKDKTYRVEVIK